jgi:membrane protease YdiL (CAAX protease family)
MILLAGLRPCASSNAYKELIVVQTESAHPHSVPWTSRDVWLGLALLGLLLVIAVPFVLLARPLLEHLDLGLFVSGGELLLLVPVWWLTVRKYRVGWERLGLRWFKWEMLGLGCGLMILSLGFNFVFAMFLGLFGLRIQPDLMPLFAGLSSPWLLLIGGAIVAPIVEEIFFRGFVFAGLRERYGWQRAAVISSVLFALIHATPTAIIPILILGYIFAFLYQRSNSIWPAILMHASTNALALGAAYLATVMDLPI